MSLEVEISVHVGDQMCILSLRSLEFSKGRKNLNFKMKSFPIVRYGESSVGVKKKERSVSVEEIKEHVECEF